METVSVSASGFWARSSYRPYIFSPRKIGADAQGAQNH